MRCAAERLEGDVTVLDLSGRQMLDMNTEVTDRIRALIREGRRKFLLNLENVAYLDSSGLGDLAGAHQAAIKEGVSLKLANVQERVAQLLRTVNLWRVFEVFDSEPEGLRSFD
jgi:anti-anti-sigma factor